MGGGTSDARLTSIIRFMDEFPEQLPLSYKMNVTGTENVIQACVDLNIPYLIQTSTSHVCVGYDLNPIFYGDERLPYTRQPINNYAKTKVCTIWVFVWVGHDHLFRMSHKATPPKVLAEKATLAANGRKLQNGQLLYSASIRPASTVYGFGMTLVLNSTTLNYSWAHTL